MRGGGENDEEKRPNRSGLRSKDRAAPGLMNHKQQFRRSTADLFSTMMLSGNPSALEEAVDESESDDRSVIGCWRLVPRRHYNFAEGDGADGEKKKNSTTDTEKAHEQDFLQRQSDYLHKIVTAFQEEQKIRRKIRNGDLTGKQSKSQDEDDTLDDNKKEKGKGRGSDNKPNEKKTSEQDAVDRFAFSMKTDSYKVEYKVEYLCEERNQVLVLALSATTYIADYPHNDARHAVNSHDQSSSSSSWPLVKRNSKIYVANTHGESVNSTLSHSQSNNVHSKDSPIPNHNHNKSHSQSHSHNPPQQQQSQPINYIKLKKYIPIFSNDKIVRRIMEMIHETYVFYMSQEKIMNRKKRAYQLNHPAIPRVLSNEAMNQSLSHSVDPSDPYGQHPNQRMSQRNSQHSTTSNQQQSRRGSTIQRRSTILAKEISIGVGKFLKSSSGSRKIRVVHIDSEGDDGGIQDKHKAFLYYFTVETAIDHYAKYLTPKGQLYCGWIGPQKLLNNEDYCFPRLPSSIYNSNMCTPIGGLKQIAPGKFLFSF